VGTYPTQGVVLGGGASRTYLTQGVVLEQPAGVGHLKGVSRLHRRALPQAQLLHYHPPQGGGTVHLGQTHLQQHHNDQYKW
jgi:hypothetical protein